MNETISVERLQVQWFPPSADDDVLVETVPDEGRVAYLEVERDEEDTNRISVHTFAGGRGSLSGYVLDREEARRFALRLLIAAEV